MISYKPQGPDPFPIRLPRQALEVKHEYFLPDDPYYHKEPAFRFVAAIFPTLFQDGLIYAGINMSSMPSHSG